MNELSKVAKSPSKVRLPQRLHHNAWVVEDQERTRVFYEDILGFPLTQFWVEEEALDGPGGGGLAFFSHAFYGLEDGSALAFFSFADDKYREKFGSPLTEMFNHCALTVNDATQEDLRTRLTEAGIFNMTIDHGYCRSLYVTDPDGLRLEFAADSPDIENILAVQARTARETLKGWVDGERRSNNVYRDEDVSVGH